jgi:poly(hydroxyalkanoate) depolymerase family esterase
MKAVPMNATFQKLMAHATRLTRRGSLREATAAIQAALAGKSEPAPPREQTFTAEVIDVEARELADPVVEAREMPEVREAPPAAAPKGAAPPAVDSKPAQFITAVHATSSMHRVYKLFVPPGAGDTPLPLVVMLHGCQQDPDDFAAGTAMNELASRQGFYVLYPAQSRHVNPQGCWNWFKHSNQQRGRGEPEMIADMTRAVMAHRAIDARRVYVAGLSAGGAMAAILGATYPDLYAAVGVHSGLAASAASDLPAALAAMRGGAASGSDAMQGVPTIVFHGDADATVHPSNGGSVIASSTGAASVVQTHAVAGGGRRPATRHVHTDRYTGRVLAEHWIVHGSPHAWSGGTAGGSYTDTSGPDASAEMIRFFLEHPRTPT